MRSSLTRLLPVLMLALALMGNAMFAAMNIFPYWQVHRALLSDVEAEQTRLDARDAAVSSDDSELLTLQIENTRRQRDDAGLRFLGQGQIDEIVESLYAYAQQTEVIIISLTTQTADDETEALANVQNLQLQVRGSVINLMNFVITFREASNPVIQLDNLAISTTADDNLMTANLRLYTSPLANDDILARAPEPLALIVAQVPPTEAPKMTAAVATPETPANELASEVSGAVNALAESPTPLQTCGTAAPSLFTVGDTVTVDFNGQSALNVLTAPRQEGSTSEVIVQAYDNHRMRLLDGPVCGTWENTEVWYWYVEYAGVQGWVGEATPANRWLCPLDNPECAGTAEG
ncbi:MAG: hypothetical protein OHK0046_25440 [Anaerolineae bacterium]